MALANRDFYNNAASSYKQNEILTASKGKLIVMLYDGAIRFLQVAIDNMSPAHYDLVNTNILKAQDIVTELMLSLDMEKGGEISKNLFSIYAWMKKRLIEANIQKDAGILKEVLGNLSTLKDSWEEVASSNEGQKPVSNLNAQGSSFSIEG